MENLFDNPTTLRNPADFVGREDLLKRIFGLIESRQNLALVGPRRMGKTSLLNALRNSEIQQRHGFAGNRFLFLYLDLQKRAMKNRVGLLPEICRILREQGQRSGFPVIEGLSEDDELEALLDEFEQRDLYLVLMMDAFDEIARYQAISEEVFGFLRSVGSEGRISFITASMKAPGEIIRRLMPMSQESSSPFYNILGAVRLSAFTPDEARLYLVDTSARGGLPFTDDEVNWVLQQAGTHPFLLQQVATLLFEEKRINSEEPIDYDFIQEEAQKNLFSHFDDFWAIIGPIERKIIIADAKRKVLMADVPPSGKRNGGMESREGRTYAELCRNELFRTYLRAAGHLEIVPPEFKDVLDHLDNPVFLGESSLAEKLPFLETRMKQQKAVTSSRRGNVIQETLKEALKSIQGQENWSHASRDWIPYNILHYRYFRQKHDISQGGVAHLLAISERQYYRLLPKAIERLWKELLMMDATATLEPGD